MKKYNNFQEAKAEAELMASRSGLLYSVRQLYASRGYVVVKGRRSPERSSPVYSAQPRRKGVA